MKKILSHPKSGGCLYTGMAPGKKDKKWKRSLNKDLVKIKEMGIDTILCLVEKDELAKLGIKNIKTYSEKLGLNFLHYPILDQNIPRFEKIDLYEKYIEKTLTLLSQGNNILVHCRCGMGRSSTFASCCAFKLNKHDVIYKCMTRINSPLQRDFVFYYCEPQRS